MLTLEAASQVCGGPALSLFRSEELELVICGTPQLNFEDLESVARYEGSYNQEHPTVKALWQVLHSFSFEEKQAFLKFSTGCNRWFPLSSYMAVLASLTELF